MIWVYVRRPPVLKSKAWEKPRNFHFLQAKQNPAKQAQATSVYERKEPHMDGPLSHRVFHILFIFTLQIISLSICDFFGKSLRSYLSVLSCEFLVTIQGLFVYFVEVSSFL